MISKLKTIAMQIKIANHSIALIEKKKPAPIINNAMTNCIRKFFS
jgi:DNA-binding XRE family transcriptional regulator